jgi:uncharacterized membrane protein YkoI
MRQRRTVAIITLTALALGVGTLGIAQALGGAASRSSVAQAPRTTDTTGDDADAVVRGSEAERAGRAAADAVGGGRVSAVEREDEPGVAWEVEVVQPDGTQVEVDLDRSLGRVAVDRDDDGAKDDDRGEAQDGNDDD